MDKDFIRLKDISNKTGLSTATLRSYIKQNKLRAIKIGGNYYVTPDEYSKLLISFYANNMGLTMDQLIDGYKRLQREEFMKNSVVL